jgi:hypothetical protein
MYEADLRRELHEIARHNGHEGTLPPVFHEVMVRLAAVGMHLLNDHAELLDQVFDAVPRPVDRNRSIVWGSR